MSYCHFPDCFSLSFPCSSCGARYCPEHAEAHACNNSQGDEAAKKHRKTSSKEDFGFFDSVSPRFTRSRSRKDDFSYGLPTSPVGQQGEQTRRTNSIGRQGQGQGHGVPRITRAGTRSKDSADGSAGRDDSLLPTLTASIGAAPVSPAFIGNSEAAELPWANMQPMGAPEQDQTTAAISANASGVSRKSSSQRRRPADGAPLESLRAAAFQQQNTHANAGMNNQTHNYQQMPMYSTQPLPSSAMLHTGPGAKKKDNNGHAMASSIGSMAQPPPSATAAAAAFPGPVPVPSLPNTSIMSASSSSKAAPANKRRRPDGPGDSSSSLYEREIHRVNEGVRQLLAYIPHSHAREQDEYIDALIAGYRRTFMAGQLRDPRNAEPKRCVKALVTYFLSYYSVLPAAAVDQPPSSSSPPHSPRLVPAKGPHNAADPLQPVAHPLFAPLVALLQAISDALLFNGLELSVFSLYLERIDPYWLTEKMPAEQLNKLIYSAYAVKLVYSEDSAVFLPLMSGLLGNFSKRFNEYLHHKAGIKLGIAPTLLNQRYALLTNFKEAV